MSFGYVTKWKSALVLSLLECFRELIPVLQAGLGSSSFLLSGFLSIPSSQKHCENADGRIVLDDCSSNLVLESDEDGRLSLSFYHVYAPPLLFDEITISC